MNDHDAPDLVRHVAASTGLPEATGLSRIPGIGAFLSMIAVQKGADILSTPNIIASDNTQAEIHVQLIAAIPNGLTVEYMPWSLVLFEDPPKMQGGQIVVPPRPGLGLNFDQAAIKRFQVS